MKLKCKYLKSCFVKNMLNIYGYMVIIKKYKVKKILTNFLKDWNKFPEIFCGEVSKLTTLHA